MTIDRTAEPEQLAIDPAYGLGKLGDDHRSLDSVYDAIRDARNWWVATVSATGRPHAVPVWGLVIDDHMLFSIGPSSIKARNLAANDRLVVHLESGDDVVIVEAATRLVGADELPAGFVDAYEAKYGFRPDPTEEGYMTVEVLPTKIMAWDEAHFAETGVRWRFS